MREYREPDADNSRWEGFRFRPGDIIIDAPSKSGTTWTQLLVALLIFEGPEFPAPVGQMSMWMDQKIRPVEETHALFEFQAHRRFIKTHTPLDGIPERQEIKYVCVARDPRDAAVSMVHQSDNIDRRQLAQLMGVSEETVSRPLGGLAERLDKFIDDDAIPGWNVSYLAHHYSTFWERRHQANVELFHFADYRRDLVGELLRLADHLEIDIAEPRAAELAEFASITAARSRASDIAPEAHTGMFRDDAAFFRNGEVGEGAHVMTPEQHQRYDAVVNQLMAPDLAAWVCGGTDRGGPTT